ncbi:SDR family oxidoreductase [Dyadobacter tibetensis]|uniref:SDR family oxidoreductase n=1 Tax=Dyadobacter tibetensis TaxID=1211851 RepID=UPI0004B95CB7|nr:SDR family oxidoreductase [Dyadobacter tibetensis]
MEIFNLSGKNAVVTGGYGYLGTAMVNALHSFGANVIVAGRSRAKFEEKFNNEHSRLSFQECDIMQSESFKKLYQNTFENFGSLDIIINNAYSSRGNDPEKMTDEDWAYTLEGGLASVHKSIRESIPYLKQQQSGKIINISSMYGMVSPNFEVYEGEECRRFLNPPHYGAAKAGIIQLTKYYAAYLGKDNIQVNTLTPGPFPSENIKNEYPGFVDRLKTKNPQNNIGVPEDLSGALILLSSKASNFITGQNLVVDGGWTSW